MNSIIKEKSFKFSVRVVNLYKYLLTTHSEYVLSKQILRSGTSIGANVSEAQEAQSDADFIAKLSISLKEARETEYWMNLLHETNFISDKMKNSLASDLNEILAILTSSLKTKKTNIAKKQNKK